ncbi:hypothetical protein [Acetobacter sp. DsW_063]|nr:hypothetical protein [Acetobacter sp. DsW_063]
MTISEEVLASRRMGGRGTAGKAGDIGRPGMACAQHKVIAAA